jgi:hypothetical protein
MNIFGGAAFIKPLLTQRKARCRCRCALAHVVSLNFRDKISAALGEHTNYVFGEVLGLSVTERAQPIVDKVIY